MKCKQNVPISNIICKQLQLHTMQAPPNTQCFIIITELSSLDINMQVSMRHSPDSYYSIRHDNTRKTALVHL